MTIRTLIATALLSVFAAGAFAHNGLRPVDQRQAHQQSRIAHGVASGQLTRNEAYRLVREQNAIRRTERHAMADGIVTRQERTHLQQMQQRASRHIAHERHDRQVRGR